MKLYTRLLIFICLFIFTGSLIYPKTAMSISIKQEEELSREVLALVYKQYKIVDDPLVVRYINRLGNKILKSLPPQPFKYQFYVIEEDVYNAFATPAGHIFFHSGLLAALDNEEEAAGIMAHEIAHVVCRHISGKIEKSKKMQWATLAGMAAGALIALGGGSGDAAAAVATGAMAAGQSKMLAYSREDEIQADERGLAYLVDSKYDASGLLTSLKKMRTKQWFSTEQIPTYLMTHPASEDRIAYIGAWLDTHPHVAQNATKIDQYEFQLVKKRLIALYEGDEVVAEKRLRASMDDNPEDALSQYGYGLILARMGKRKEAVGYIKKSLKKRPFDAFILTDLGRIYYLEGKYDDAITTLEGAISIEPKYPESLFYLAKTHIEKGDYHRAANILEPLTKNSPNYHQAFYALGEAYGKQGQNAEAHYYLGLFYWRQGNSKKAKFHLERAAKTINNKEKLAKINELLEKYNKKSKDGRKRS